MASLTRWTSLSELQEMVMDREAWLLQSLGSKESETTIIAKATSSFFLAVGCTAFLAGS